MNPFGHIWYTICTQILYNSVVVDFIIGHPTFMNGILNYGQTRVRNFCHNTLTSHPKKRSRLQLEQGSYKNLCLRVHERDSWKCRVCKARHSLHAHHIVYRSQNGDDIESNLVTLCSFCHKAVHSGNIIILTLYGEQGGIDANMNLKFYFAAGWLPGKAA